MTIQLLQQLLPTPIYETELPAGEAMPLFQEETPVSFIHGVQREEAIAAGNCIYLLREGLLRIIRQEGSHPVSTRYFVKSPQLFGELALAGQEKEHYFAEALSHCCISVFQAASVKQRVLKSPDLAQYFWKLLARRFNFIRQQMLFFPDMPSRQRILIFLTAYAREIADNKGFPLQVDNFLTRQDLAFHTGTSLPEVKKVIQQLEKEGKLVYTKEKIIIFSI